MFVVIMVGIKAQGKKKKGQYNWLFFMLIALGVPIAATFHTLGYVLLTGFVNIFTGRFIHERVAADKDSFNKYKINEKASKVGGAVNDSYMTEGPVAAAMVATSAATAAFAAAVMDPPKKSMNPLRPLYSAYQGSVFKTQKGEDKPNFNFNKKARRIRKDAMWFVLGLGVVTSVLAMLDSSTKIMKSTKANEYIHKMRMVLI